LLCARNSIEWIVAAHAVRAAGRALVPISFSLTSPEIAYVIGDCAASLVLCDAERLEVVRSAADVHSVKAATIEQLSEMGGPERTRADGSAPFILYTSGTSGKPKGAYHRRSPEGAMATAYAQVFDLRPGDVHLVAGPLYHSAPSAFCGITLSLQGTAVVMSQFDPLEALRLIEQHAVTTAFMAPILLRRLLDLGPDVIGRFDLGSMRSIITAGSRCPQKVKRDSAELFGEVLYEFYGSTETKAVFVIGPGDQLQRPGSCGRTFPGVEALLLDEQGHEVGVGEPGRVHVLKTDWMFDHYLKDPAKTAEVIRDGWIATDDLATRDADGFHYICGRVSDMVLSGGVNIYPAEVELALIEHPSVADVAVFGVADEIWGERLHAIVQPSGEAPGPAELEEFLRARIAGFKVPRSWEFVERLGRGEDGKLRKTDLR